MTIFLGETAYIVFASGGGKTYETIFAKSSLHQNATECILKAAHENFACITGEGVATFAIASSVTTFKNGESPLQLSRSNANFVEGGVVSVLMYKRLLIFTVHYNLNYFTHAFLLSPK